VVVNGARRKEQRAGVGMGNGEGNREFFFDDQHSQKIRDSSGARGRQRAWPAAVRQGLGEGWHGR
jgi:hypothetical protein